LTALRRALLACFVVGLGFSITLSEASLAALVGLWLVRLADPGRRRAAAWPLAAPLAAWAAVTVVSALASGHAARAFSSSREVLLALAVWAVADALGDAGEAERFVSALAVAAAVAGAMGVAQVGLCPQPEPAAGLARWFFHRCDRARGAFSIYMTLAGVLNLALLLTVPRIVPPPRPRWALPAWLLALAGLAATLTRGAWVGFAAGIAAFLPTARRGRAVLVAGLAVLALATLAGPANLRHRVASMTDLQDPTVREREYMWRSGFAMWRDHPWLGAGPGGVKREFSRYASPEAIKKRTGHLHNTPLQILVELGAIGLAAWLWIWIAFFTRATGLFRRLPADALRERALAAGSIAAIAGFLVAGLWEYNFGDSEVVLLAWTVVALPFTIDRAQAEEDKAGPPSPFRERAG
jgi:putative inorganic carbon (HCO3(-)) transporter